MKKRNLTLVMLGAACFLLANVWMSVNFSYMGDEPTWMLWFYGIEGGLDPRTLAQWIFHASSIALVMLITAAFIAYFPNGEKSKSSILCAVTAIGACIIPMAFHALEVSAFGQYGEGRTFKSWNDMYERYVASTFVTEGVIAGIVTSFIAALLVILCWNLLRTFFIGKEGATEGTLTLHEKAINEKESSELQKSHI